MKALRRLLLSLAAVWGAAGGAFAAEPLKSIAPPKPLPTGAVTEDWPRFLGPHENATSGETKLLHTWGEKGPARVWEYAKGESFGSPAVVGKRLVFFHRLGDREVVECLDAETGQPQWSHSYEAPYQDRYGSGNGPRSGPVIADGCVFTYGVTGHLQALDLETGKPIWQHDAEKEFALEPNFFGHGSAPLVTGGRVIVQLGGKDNLIAAAFDPATGKLLWKAKHEWGASYASPVPAIIHGRECVLLFAGGESRPPTGGLLCLDAATGEVLSAMPHRAEIAESVNASSPVVSGDRVFVSESYGSGGEMVEFDADLKAKTAWKAPEVGVYFMNPVIADSVLYASSGQSPRLAEIVACDVATGKELWRDDLGGKFGRTSLLQADGAFLALGEFGDLAWVQFTRTGAKVLQQAKLFNAPDTWTLPALSHGLLYIAQNGRASDGSTPRIICYDLRGQP